MAGPMTGEKRVGQNMRVLADRVAKSVLDGGPQGVGQGAIVALVVPELDRFGDHGTQVLSAPSRVIKTLADICELFLLRSDNQVPQFLESVVIVFVGRVLL